MNYRALLAATLTAVTIQLAACDSFWLPRCGDPKTPGCSFTLKTTQSELWCGEDAQLDLQVQADNGEDLSAEEMMRAADIKVALRLPSGVVLPLPTPAFAEDHLRIQIPKGTLTTQPPAPAKLELSYARTTLTAALNYSCERRSFRQVAVQRLNDIGLTGAPLKFAGLTQLIGSPSGLVFASASASDSKNIQYHAYKLTFSPKGLLPGPTVTPPTNPGLSFNDIRQLRVALEKPATTDKGYVYFVDSEKVITDSQVTSYATVKRDMFSRPLIAATAASSVVATWADGHLMVHGDLPKTYASADVQLQGIRAMTLGDIDHNGHIQLLIAQPGGIAAVANIVVPSMAGGTVMATFRDETELTSKLSQIDGRDGLIISVLALADFGANHRADVMALRSLPPSGAQSQLGIIYKSATGTYEDWRPVHITEDPELSPVPILTQDIQSIDVGLLDDDQVPDLAIATKTEVRLYLGVAH